MTITVRPATEDDLPALMGLYAELHPEDPPLPAVRATRIWQEIAGQAGRTVLLGIHGDAVVGTADCVVAPNLTRGGRPYMLVENVVVGKTARRQGVGTRLLESALAVARAAGCYKVQLLSRADRADAHGFYESCGIKPTAKGYRAYLD